MTKRERFTDMEAFEKRLGEAQKEGVGFDITLGPTEKPIELMCEVANVLERVGESKMLTALGNKLDRERQNIPAGIDPRRDGVREGLLKAMKFMAEYPLNTCKVCNKYSDPDFAALSKRVCIKCALEESVDDWECKQREWLKELPREPEAEVTFDEWEDKNK